MKKLLFIILTVFLCLNVIGQIPQAFNYQGVARDLQGTPLGDAAIQIRITILEGSANGTASYSETHELTTSSLGLFAVQIGSGSVAAGVFEDIDWENAEHFVRVELDDNSGSGFEVMGSSQLLSVPYALASANGSKWDTNQEGIHYNEGAVAIGKSSPDPSAILDISVTDKGLLLPNVALIASTDFAPLDAHVEGMMVYNTATNNDVSPGVYLSLIHI